MLQEISILGLRGFSRSETVRFAQPTSLPGSGITYITGPNNSGKSTIIEALKLKSSTIQNPSLNTGVRNSYNEIVEINYKIDDENFVLKSTRPGSSETFFSKNNEFSPYVLFSRRNFPQYFGKAPPSQRDQYVRQFSSYQGLREQTLTHFENRLFALERDYIEFNKILQKLIPDFMDWSLDQAENGQYFIKFKSPHKTHSISGSGDGIMSIFVVASSLFDSQPGEMIVIDEPELSLHPSLQKRLVDVLKTYAIDRQIVLSTHSPYIVDTESLMNGASVVRVWDRGDKIDVYNCDKINCDGLSKLISGNINNPHVFGLDAKDVFFSIDPVVVLEGQEDVVFWPAIVKFKPSLGSLNVYGWGAGGSSNVKNIMSLLKCLGYRKVLAVLDNNRPDDKKQLESLYPDYKFFEIPAPDIRTKPAQKAKPAVEGLINKDGIVRPEFESNLSVIIDEIEEFVKI